MTHVGAEVTVCGWVQRVRKMGGLLFVDLRDRWGIVQLVVSDAEATLRAEVESLGREWVVSARGVVRERSSKNTALATGEVEIE